MLSWFLFEEGDIAVSENVNGSGLGSYIIISA